MNKDVFNRIKKIVKENTNIDLKEEQANAKFEEVGIDSMQGMSLILEIESQFNVTIPEDKLTGIKNFADIIALIESLTAK
ncbi:MAG: acyl carrier protein [Mycoplasmataceae bacterium]|jgi:acyl carrier protein|nr:acyl carrier protein [Mycoplasmataceae bacterium]